MYMSSVHAPLDTPDGNTIHNLAPQPDLHAYWQLMAGASTQFLGSFTNNSVKKLPPTTQSSIRGATTSHYNTSPQPSPTFFVTTLPSHTHITQICISCKHIFWTKNIACPFCSLCSLEDGPHWHVAIIFNMQTQNPTAKYSLEVFLM